MEPANLIEKKVLRTKNDIEEAVPSKDSIRPIKAMVDIPSDENERGSTTPIEAPETGKDSTPKKRKWYPENGKWYRFSDMLKK